MWSCPIDIVMKPPLQSPFPKVWPPIGSHPCSCSAQCHLLGNRWCQAPAGFFLSSTKGSWVFHGNLRIPYQKIRPYEEIMMVQNLIPWGWVALGGVPLNFHDGWFGVQLQDAKKYDLLIKTDQVAANQNWPNEFALRIHLPLLWKNQTLLVTPLWFWHPMTSQGFLGWRDFEDNNSPLAPFQAPSS